MPRRSRLQPRPETVVDLTLSDNEAVESEPEPSPQLFIPEPTQPSRPRRLTARECLRADRIAFGEIDVPPPPDAFMREPSSPSLLGTLDLGDEIAPDDGNVHQRPGPSRQRHEPSPALIGGLRQARPRETGRHEPLQVRSNGSDLGNGNYIQEGASAAALSSQQSDTSPVVIHSSSDSGDSSGDEVEVYGDNDIVDLTGLVDEEPEVMEMMVNGNPRRACAPTSFKGLLKTGERTLIQRVLQGSAVELTDKERANADRFRDDLIGSAVAAHRALWKNRHVHKYSYNCGRVAVGRARTALMQMGHFIGASPEVVKTKGQGKSGSYVTLKVGNNLWSPEQLDIREVADKLIDRAFKEHVKNKTSASKRRRESRREKKKRQQERKKGKKKKNEKTLRAMEWSERMREVAQDVRKDEDAFDRVVPMQVEIQRGDVKRDGRGKRESAPAGVAVKEEVLPLSRSVGAPPRDTLLTSVVANSACGTERKRRAQTQESARQSKECRREEWERKRQRKLEGTKIETGNKGFAMLAKMGWSEGQGLGARKSGISEPIFAEFRTGRKGLGTKKI